MWGVVLYQPLPYSLETGSLTEPRGRLAASKPQWSFFSVSHNSRVMVHMRPHPDCLIVLGVCTQVPVFV